MPWDNYDPEPPSAAEIMATNPIRFPKDQRVKHCYSNLNGHRYHFLLGEPKQKVWRGTILLVHGWPDLSAGWRYQIPLLLDLGFRVVAPDLMGFGETGCPHVPPNSINLYGYKRASDDFALLAKQLGATKLIIGGHDWGGMVVWRMAMVRKWYPNLVTHVFSVCTPYTRPQPMYQSTEDLVKGPVPQFGYQLHLASPEVEGRIKTREDMRRFLSGMYGARGPNRESIFTPERGILFENLSKVGKTRLLNDEEMDYYVEQYSRNGLHGTVNWYRTRRSNYEEDLGLKTSEISQPCLFIQATRDSVLTPDMATGMGRNILKLVVKEVVASHWALWERPAEVNAILEKWLRENVLSGKSSL